MPRIIALASLVFLLTACAEVGSERWCNNMADKPKGDWSTNEATDYAKHCVFRSDDE